MHEQLFDNYDEIFSFYHATKTITSKLSTLFKIPKHRIQTKKLIALNNDQAEPTIKI